MSSGFNELQKKALLTACLGLHERMRQMEGRIAETEAGSPFSKLVDDFPPADRRVLLDYFARLRETMFDLLASNAISLSFQPVSLRWSLRTMALALQVATAEMGPRRLVGYGQLSDEGRLAALRFEEELNRIIWQVSRLLAQPSATDYERRIGQTDTQLTAVAPMLRTVAEVVDRRGMVEFRPRLDAVVDRLHDARLEVAVFGRVSSGKSTLLNHIAGTDVLPVGITPITAVPTRLTWGSPAAAIVTTIESGRRTIPVVEVVQFISEEQNPGNVRHVVRIEISLPAPKLSEGLVFVDTPGIGSLAKSGSAETFAYLPRCDLGIVLIDSATTINDDDIKLIGLLSKASIPIHVLLSKADLLNPADLSRLVQYVHDQIHSQLHLDVPVVPVSTIGDREEMLRSWFDHQISPLRERNHEVLAKSLRQKSIPLRDSLVSALKFERERRGGEIDVPKNVDDLATQLQAGDDAIRQLREFHVGDRTRSVSYADRAATAMDEALRRGDTAATALKDLAEELMSSAAHEALERVEAGKARVVESARNLDILRPSSAIDVASIQSLAASELPPFEFSLRREFPVPGWWMILPTMLSRCLLARQFDREIGHEFSEALRDYERQLDTWLHGKGDALASAYLQQTEVTRAHLRMVRNSPMEPTRTEVDSIDADIRKLESDEM